MFLISDFKCLIWNDLIILEHFFISKKINLIHQNLKYPGTILQSLAVSLGKIRLDKVGVVVEFQSLNNWEFTRKSGLCSHSRFV